MLTSGRQQGKTWLQCLFGLLCRNLRPTSEENALALMVACLLAPELAHTIASASMLHGEYDKHISHQLQPTHADLLDLLNVGCVMLHVLRAMMKEIPMVEDDPNAFAADGEVSLAL